ncbi:uncharacterized protein LOC112521736 [Cynara cardunculus var. scolymus]|uniref:uncharacterized protein LOC112521736 n=1 Tax=Cynara cardunculus var. scolymus TaxID=59895 RepID=UPI000D63096C|nr:uncharacterized protein LOC112521736 [Cynara cardunculus var. scolymus]
MGQDLELDFEKYCVVDGSPKTVLLSPRHLNVEKRKVRKKPKCRNEVSLSQNKEFTEISFNRYRSASCRTVPSIRLEVDESPRRGSVYQSSNQVGKMNRIREKETEGRKKIELSRRSAASFSFEIVDSLCSSDEDNSSLGSFTSSSLGISRSSVNKENLSMSNDDKRPHAIPLHKSLSARLAMPHSPTKTESDSSKPTSPKTRFSPFRKMFDPFTKPKSQKSPLGSAIEEPDEPTSSSNPPVNTRNVTLRKSLLNDFSNTEGDTQSIKKDSCSSIVSSSSSPAHLSGFLKLRDKNGVPYFEFSVKNPHDVWVAKTWKTGDGFNWVYTFHMAQNRRKSNASGRGSKDHRSKEFLMMAQMQVSCYLCTELIHAGAFDNSMFTEFVLYDLVRPRQSVAQMPEGLNPKESSNEVKLEESTTASDCLTASKVSVVIPSGNHGLPSSETRGASPLLDRWRSGGGCDCGGWDMGCPLVVFGSSDLKKDDACNLPVEIFLKGTKENTPALTMKLTEEGQYAVDFHAQLSSLQAFSVCVAILHGTEASIAIGGDMNRKIMQCDSLRVFIEDEVKHLIDAVAEGEKRKTSKNLDEIPPTFVVNPPFSPMSRA